MSKFFFLNLGFVGLYVAAMIFALATVEPVGVMATYVKQLSQLRLPVNLLLLLWLGSTVVRKKPMSATLAIIAMFNWLTLIDDYFVMQIQTLAFESALGVMLASLRPIVAASLTLLAIEAKLHERGSDQ